MKSYACGHGLFLGLFNIQFILILLSYSMTLASYPPYKNHPVEGGGAVLRPRLSSINLVVTRQCGLKGKNILKPGTFFKKANVLSIHI